VDWGRIGIYSVRNGFDASWLSYLEGHKERLQPLRGRKTMKEKSRRREVSGTCKQGKNGEENGQPTPPPSLDGFLTAHSGLISRRR